MNKEHFEINVSFKGYHDHTITIDRNGPDNTNIETAKTILRTLRAEYGPEYNLTLSHIVTPVAIKRDVA